ncbi:glycosyltransferase family 4 protein [Alphaproteobacteria bacterium]|nr:glycosyltransferase family 4 protein [Alphaproteobacteria bacterium]
MKVPILVDYDDATFHRYDTHPNFLIRIFLKGKIDSVMRAASIVTAGNQYLSKRAQRAGANRVFTIPTVVDLRYYQPAVASRDNEQLIVGWIGTPMTSHYLEPLIPSFVRLSMRFNVRFVAVGANAIDFKNTPIETWDWHLETEVECIRQFDVGIMPLSNNAWERGKCGYKLIQYMGCAIPVVASPVGVNSTIVKSGINGFLAHDKEWDCMLTKLLSDSELRKTLGRNARKDVEECYSTQVQAPRLLQAMKQSIYIIKP